MLMIAAAGMSLLLVSLLFRLVLWRGLIKPLQSLTGDLSRLSADSLGQRTLDPVGQSRELQPIVEAFNQLQARLAEAWQRDEKAKVKAAAEKKAKEEKLRKEKKAIQEKADKEKKAVGGASWSPLTGLF